MDIETPQKLLNEIKGKEVAVKSEQKRIAKDLKEKSEDIEKYTKTADFLNYFAKAEAELNQRDYERNSIVYEDMEPPFEKEDKQEYLEDLESVKKEPFFKRLFKNFINII